MQEWKLSQSAGAPPLGSKLSRASRGEVPQTAPSPASATTALSSSSSSSLLPLQPLPATAATGGGGKPARENGQGFVVEQLSLDHNVTLATESARIERGGASIADGRVNGVLEVTRSFGDLEFKEVVTAEPHVSVKTIDRARDAFIVIACDGVYDVLSDSEVCATVLRKFAALKTTHTELPLFTDAQKVNSCSLSLSEWLSTQPYLKLADCLATVVVAEAIANKSDDNVSCVVILL